MSQEPELLAVTVPPKGGGPVVACVTCRPISAQCDSALMALQGRGVQVWRVRNSSLLCNVRSQVLERAFQGGADRMLFVDDDIAFDPGHALHLLFDELPADCVAAGGLYAVKGEPRLCAWGFEGPIEIGTPGFVPVEHIGAGFLMITRKAFDALQDLPGVVDAGMWYRPYFCPGVFDFHGNPVLLGEDYAFCEELKARGLQMYLATLPRLGHVGEFAWYVEDSLSAQNGRLRPFATQVRLETGPAAPPPPSLSPEVRQLYERALESGEISSPVCATCGHARLWHATNESLCNFYGCECRGFIEGET